MKFQKQTNCNSSIPSHKAQHITKQRDKVVRSPTQWEADLTGELSASVCMYISLYICAYLFVCLHVSICICAYVRTYQYLWVSVSVSVYRHVLVYVFVRTCKCMSIYVYLLIFTYLSVRIYLSIFLYIYLQLMTDTVKKTEGRIGRDAKSTAQERL